ncbi:hypothetical protein [Magnetospirillum moscoviense]|uniref:Uncharacterized protein n=1 Tax=Magnetospirillum moscoviense TaxID=1437059 RepID=A0A178MZP9_9PROT|nr:hypothetical protein [Magnetospirillum moscoviense]OAN67609.1 hypothetical protein A6A05_18240 [Magnetospirillum moscoviense]
MVDDLDITRRTQYAPLAPVQPGVQLVNPIEEAAQQSLTVVDAVQLSAQASARMKDMREMLEGSTIAEAWLRHKLEPPDLNDPRALENSARSTDSNSEDKEKQDSLKSAFRQTMNDIGWLLDAIGVNKADTDPIAEAIAQKAASTGVGILPPLPETIARARQAGAVAALFVENIGVTIQRSKVVDVAVDRVTITQVHDSVGDRFAGTDKPLVLDVGGELQMVRTPSEGSRTFGAITPNARPESDSATRTAEALSDAALRPEDPRRALLIVREGGQLHREGTVRVKMDALMPIR